MANNNKSKFAFDEIVKIINSKNKYHDILIGKIGYIAGMAMDDYGQWVYGVCLLDSKEVGNFEEEELQSTGKFVPENYNMTGESIRVVVNEKGEGEIKED